MMRENYTAEDFARATVATRGTSGAARRVDTDDGAKWMTNDLAWPMSDEEMTAGGWVPVVESRITEHTLRDTQDNAGRNRQRLVDHIADQDRVIRRRNDEIAALRRELADAQAPLSLDTLAAAWEAADEATEEAPIREGDVVIVRHGGGFTVEPADRILSGQTHGRERILSRAPREPWQDLADDLQGTPTLGTTGQLAEALYALGWRKGGDE